MMTPGTIVRYALLPGLWPRAKELFGGGFPHLAFLIANLFEMMRLLPANHAYLLRANFGRYSILDVMRAAYTGLGTGWRNIDKFIVFFTVLAGLIMLVVQFFLMIAAILVAPAQAQSMPTTIGGFLRTPYPEDDLAFRMMDLVFGIPGLFGMASTDKSTPFQLALQALLEFYSYGLFAVGVIILIYICIVVVAETAQSGIPFGKRFNRAWAPIRLVLFLGLLIPISHGLNGAQYVVFLSAKAGSGLATNGWRIFNETISDTYMGDRETLVMTPQPPDLSSVPAFIMLAKTCKLAVAQEQQRDVRAWVIVNGTAQEFGSSTFQDITAKTKGNVIVRFGEKNDAYTDYAANVMPVCGEMFFYTSDIAEPGSAVIQNGYFNMVKQFWVGGGGGGGGSKTGVATIAADIDRYAQAYVDHFRNENNQLPDPKFRGTWAKLLDNYMLEAAVTGVSGGKTDASSDSGAKTSNGLIGDAVQKQVAEGDFDVDAEVMKKGWAGAAIWYNQIAKQNGALVASVRNLPTPNLYPDMMVQVERFKSSKDQFVTDTERFSLSLRDGGTMQPADFKNGATDAKIAALLNEIYLFWQSENIRGDKASAKRSETNSMIVDAINLFFGTSGLFDMCKNVNVHPLAQLSGVGKGMIESAIRGFAQTAIMGAGSSLLSALSPYLGQAGFAASGFMLTVAGIGLMMGFILFYLMPFLPFLYFFFAAGGWMKGLFEAVIGAPLWALGHLRIDGEGMVGEAAKDGYYMALEIFLRPILIVVGLVTSLIIFAALVRVLNDIFAMVVSNLPAGADGAGYCFTGSSEKYESFRGPIDEFFYTIVYAIVVYLIGMSSFKLIDGIPRSIMRWMGEDVAAFSDQAGDAAEGLVQRIAVSGAGIGKKLESGLTSSAGQLQGGISGLMNMFK